MPKAFISYSWDSSEHRSWVRDLASRLRRDGVETILDQWHLVPGDQLPLFMENAVHESDYVLIICTPHYKQRSDDRSGGVGYEGDIMTGVALVEGDRREAHRKFIPILRGTDWSSSAPRWLAAKYRIDLRGEPYSEAEYSDLLATLLGNRPGAPPVGQREASSPTDTGKKASPAKLLTVVLGIPGILLGMWLVLATSTTPEDFSKTESPSVHIPPAPEPAVKPQSPVAEKLLGAATPLNVDCSGSPNPAAPNEQVTWSVKVSGGAPGPYSFAWTGNDSFPPQQTGPTVITSYHAEGPKDAHVTVVSGNQSTSADCGIQVARK